MFQSLARTITESETKYRQPNKFNSFNLSKYFPAGTVYFYSFPAGEDSNFFNAVPPWKEELVAARPLVSGGRHIRAVTFASAVRNEVWNLLAQDLGVELISRDQVISLPGSIHAEISGQQRNQLVKAALRDLVRQGDLVMAQPFLRDDLRDHYQISPDLVVALNDKNSLAKYFPMENIPVVYASFSSGLEFAEDAKFFPLPCVVKVASSSSGDGVRICRSRQDLVTAKNDFKILSGTIFVEEFIDILHNLCIQFGIPADPAESIEIIGQNEQLVSAQGDYLGGVVNPKKNLKKLQEIYHLLLSEVLPRIRATGWYGVGGIDVLVSKNEQIYFIDPNFRMTAAFTYVCLHRNQKIKKPVASFTGMFRSEAEFKKRIVPIAREGSPNQLLTMIALTKNDDGYRFNAGMFFDDHASLRQNATDLLKLGISSNVLEKLAHPQNLI